MAKANGGKKASKNLKDKIKQFKLYFIDTSVYSVMIMCANATTTAAAAGGRRRACTFQTDAVD